MAEQKIRVFVCVENNSTSEPGCSWLFKALADEGFELKRETDVLPGLDVRAEMEKIMAACDAVLLVHFQNATYQLSKITMWPEIQIESLNRLCKSRYQKVIPVLFGDVSKDALPKGFQHLAPARLPVREAYSRSDFQRLFDAIGNTRNKIVPSPKRGSGYYTEIVVGHFRCFQEPQTLQLSLQGTTKHAKWTVMLGDNGVGKTTLLRVLAASAGDGPEEWRLAQASVQASGGSPLCYGYGAGRGTRTARLTPTDVGPCDTLFDDSASLPDPEEWFLQTDYAARVSEDKVAVRRRDRIEKVLVQLLPDVEKFRIGVNANQQAELQVKTPYGWVPLRDLSLGYKTALTWMVDLARRMFDRYPESENPLAEPAVVLVDEIDLHLHPKWQRELLRTLDETFPKAQFIVTAHSPLIVQAAPNANTALLRREGDHVVIDNDKDYIRRWRVDQILASELFEQQPVHAPDVQDMMDERVHILSKADVSDQERVRVEELDRELRKLPTAVQPEDQRAMELIRETAELLRSKTS